MAQRPLFSFGGCVYRLMVSTQHAGALASLAVSASVRGDGPQLADISYMHTSNLPQGRALWLREQIADKRLTWAVSVDGDTSFVASSLHSEMERVDGSFAIGLAPVRIGGTDNLCNLCITDEDERVSARADGAAPPVGRRAFATELAKVIAGDRQISSGGFGVAVFNLRWFRQCWPLPEVQYYGSTIDIGEDIAFCQNVRARGGMIAALNVRTDHFAFGEKQTR